MGRYEVSKTSDCYFKICSQGRNQMAWVWLWLSPSVRSGVNGGYNEIKMYPYHMEKFIRDHSILSMKLQVNIITLILVLISIPASSLLLLKPLLKAAKSVCKEIHVTRIKKYKTTLVLDIKVALLHWPSTIVTTLVT